MRLALCGTGAGPFTAQRASSGYILQTDGGTIMLDCGPGSVREALCLGIDLRTIDAIFISHLHEDHCLDLASVAFQSMYGRWERLPLLLGPAGTHEAASRLMAMQRPNAHVPPLQVLELDDGDETDVAGFSVLSKETPHAPGIKAYARRFTADGRSLVFSGDTSVNPDMMVGLSTGADLLLHECFSRAGLDRYAALRGPEAAARVRERIPLTHSELSGVARIAEAAGVPRLVLTHILRTENDADLLAEASKFYSGEIIVARDGLTLDV
jgi:ribonuclease BN (tRNA processing enzyme)